MTVEGRLSDRFAAVFDGMSVEAGAGETTLVGPVADQAALCELVGVSEVNQRVLLHRARARVRQALEDYLA